MKAFLKTQWFNLLTLLFCVAVLVLSDTPLLLDPGRFDELATIGWTAVPFALCWLMLSVASNLKEYGKARAAEALAMAGKLDADMWSTRHATKAWRKGNTV